METLTFSSIRGHMNNLVATGLTVDECDDLMRRYDAAEIDRIASILSDIATIATDGDGTSQYDLAIATHNRPGHKAGELVFWEYQSVRDEDKWHVLDGWPECECCGCGCSDPATTTDDGGVPVCDACSEYTVDSDGDVHCGNMDDVEIVTESCGAGNQTRSYARIKPPGMPDEDPDGKWACYWDTAGNDSHVVSRHSTRDGAEQAVSAHDFPRPGDHTQYLCGYAVRELVDDRWVDPDTAEYDV
jgi:hypothetical protein